MKKVILILVVLSSCIDNTADEFSDNGYKYIDEKKYQLAILEFNKAIEIDTTHKKSYKGKASAKYKLEDFEGSLLDINKAIEIDPNDDEAYFSRGYFKYKMGKLRAAIMDYNRAIDLNPDDQLYYYATSRTKFELEDSTAGCLDLIKMEVLFDVEDYDVSYRKMHCN